MVEDVGDFAPRTRDRCEDPVVIEVLIQVAGDDPLDPADDCVPYGAGVLDGERPTASKVESDQISEGSAVFVRRRGEPGRCRGRGRLLAHLDKLVSAKKKVRRRRGWPNVENVPTNTAATAATAAERVFVPLVLNVLVDEQVTQFQFANHGRFGTVPPVGDRLDPERFQFGGAEALLVPTNEVAWPEVNVWLWP